MDFCIIYNIIIIKLTIIDEKVTADEVSLYCIPADVAYAFILSITVAHFNSALRDTKWTNIGVVETEKVDWSFQRAFTCTYFGKNL